MHHNKYLDNKNLNSYDSRIHDFENFTKGINYI